ncbi:type 4 fimbrial biosynthesis protein [Piscinibacter aquaticus]|uniref:Type 4 fimbrial biosynthesis protein n=1 Tax=Piscinibacter aquaticus TaxID=392597 RepID=A0A5C6U1F7_9BURK|nr:type 4 fimbrial biosynthesis protein [Piscinibacter aquaticus]
MIVVAIVSILATIAVPSYQDYVRRGKLPEAFTYLSDYRVKLEQYYQDNRNYGGNACGSGASWAGFAPADARNFTFSCTLAADKQSYTLTASGVDGQHVYTLATTGAKATTTFKGATVASKACWLTKGTEC